jgi:glycosyltransferase involved in cell wall biosynthesis
VITIHDLNHLYFGSYAQKAYYQFILKPFASRSKRVVSVSQSSARAIEDWLKRKKSDRSKAIEIAYNAFESPVLPDSSQENEILGRFHVRAKNYFLSLSDFKPHRNMDLLLTAYRKAKFQNPEIWPILHKGTYGRLTELERVVLMKNAGAFLFPSLYEGAGLPPVEAGLLGTSVIVSDLQVHREMLGDIPQNQITYCSPHQVEEWASVLAKFQDRPALSVERDALSKTLRRFSVANLANAMDQIYRNVLG